MHCSLCLGCLHLGSLVDWLKSYQSIRSMNFIRTFFTVCLSVEPTNIMIELESFWIPKKIVIIFLACLQTGLGCFFKNVLSCNRQPLWMSHVLDSLADIYSVFCASAQVYGYFCGTLACKQPILNSKHFLWKIKRIFVTILFIGSIFFKTLYKGKRENFKPHPIGKNLTNAEMSSL